MRRGVIAGALAISLVLFGGGAALADNPPANEHSPLVGTGLHTHHVVTGTSDCVNIDAVAFAMQDRGLHRGATEGTVAHRPCP
jgi:hypothetical protein